VTVRILFIHEVNYLNKVIFEMHEYPELLALRGHEVTFLHYPEAPDVPRRSARTRRERIHGRVHRDAELTLVTPPTFGGGRFERYLAPLLALPTLLREIQPDRYDVIVLYAVPTTGWQALMIARRRGIPVVFRALDVSHQIRRSLLSPRIKRAEKYVYRNATLLSANNPALAEYCVQLSGRSARTEVQVPPIDFSHFEDLPHDDLREGLGIAKDDRVVLYMGTFFDFSGLDVVVKGIQAVLAQHPTLRLVLVGGGELDRSLRSAVASSQLSDRVLFTGVVAYSELPHYLKLADVAINPFRPELLTNVALPHKVLQYMAAGVPTVSTSLRGLRGVLGEDSGVTWVEGPESVAAAAGALALRPTSELGAIARKQRERVRSRFEKESAVAAFEEALSSVR
jgi:glycosyltransferase involved in cell wall biosynthesis